MNGLLLIDKPAGITSHDVVDRVRNIAGIRAVGHAGTLDPFATGLLILGVGKATKWLTGLVGLDKEYEATLKLGSTSDTFDIEGKITKISSVTPSDQAVDDALNQFRGGYDQRAPLHSAKKIGGKKLYELARAGTATEDMRPVKHVTIPTLEIMDYDWPTLKLRIVCSSGTYIRSLADDIGQALGIGGYLTELRRTRIGTFHVSDAVPLSLLDANALETNLKTDLDN